MKILLFAVLLPAVFALGFSLGARLVLHRRFAPFVYGSAGALPSGPSGRVAIVLGAGVTAEGRPGPILQDRVAAAVDLYRSGRVQKLLLTGWKDSGGRNEAAAMRLAALELGAPEDALLLDEDSVRTRASCVRAREAFGVDRAVVVTQAFHMDRALALCAASGIDAVSLLADRSAYPLHLKGYWIAREIPATLRAWFDLDLRKNP